MATPATLPAASRIATLAPSPWRPTSRIAAARTPVSTVNAAPVSRPRVHARRIRNAATSTRTQGNVGLAYVDGSTDSPAKRTYSATQENAIEQSQARLVLAPVSTNIVKTMEPPALGTRTAAQTTAGARHRAILGSVALPARECCLQLSHVPRPWRLNTSAPRALRLIGATPSPV